MDLIISAPINNLSFGNVSFNILREIYKKGKKVSLFPIGDIDFSAFDKVDKDFVNWVKNAHQYRLHGLDKEIPTLKLWHINGAEDTKSKHNFLLTFYELDQPTFTEKKLLQFQDGVFLTNPTAEKTFQGMGCNNIAHVDLGFDSDFFKIDKRIVKNKTHFVLMGKYEKRKHTKEIIKLWLKKYGNNNNFLLTCCISNPFFKGPEMQRLIQDLTGDTHYSNINFLPHLKTNTEVNHLLNSADIDLTGLSGAEGWNLPAFNATCLGKWSIVYYHTGHQSWATKNNCILLEPNEKEEAYDGFFFGRNSDFNQGNIFKLDEKQVSEAMDEAIEKCKNVNEEGLKLGQNYTYENTAGTILKYIDDYFVPF